MKLEDKAKILNISLDELEKLEEYRKYNFNHESAEDFLKDEYKQVFLSVAYVNEGPGEAKNYLTELKLAREAIKEDCECVRSIDYCGPCIAALGYKFKGKRI